VARDLGNVDIGLAARSTATIQYSRVDSAVDD
jgi:hypothetical protein